MPATKFDKPIFPGAKLVSATVTVTNTSGSYSNTFLDERIATSMKADRIEVGDPSIFNDKISITTGDGSFTIACNSVAGSTSVTVSFLKIADDPTEVTSAEFDILNNRIGTLANLTTTDKTNIVAAVNEVNGGLEDAIEDIEGNTQAIASANQAIGNKTEYTTIIATSYAYNAKESYDFVYDELPTTYVGMVRINFSGGYWVFGMAYKYSNIYGSIYTIINDNVMPFYYTRSNSSYGKLGQLALKNDYVKTTAITLDNDGNGTISYPSGFTTANCYIESIKVDLSGNVYCDHPNFVILQRSGDIRIGCGNNFAGASVVALLHKI